MDEDVPSSPLHAGFSKLSFLPLGGLGEIGMNCFVLDQDGELLVVDCGATFPDDDVGEDLIVPDFSFLVKQQEKIAGIFITHGHEDHIGALPHLIRRLDREIPIYAPAHAAALIATRFEEQGLDDSALRLVEPGETYAVGSFFVEPIRVAHSIVQATALAIQSGVGMVVHTGDFDLDPVQPAGWLTDEERFKALGRDGVVLLLSDSTNIGTEERSFHEGTVGEELIAQVCGATGRIVVGMFSSNAHRLAALIQAAQSSERKLCLLGRSLRRQFDIAKNLGHLHCPSNLLVAPEQLRNLSRTQVLVVAGGSQGEATSALKKISLATHPHLELEAGDAVILSSRVIPGNEKRVFSMTNDLRRRGVDVVTRSTNPKVHESGHASRSELRKMIEWVKPRSFIPVHGTLTHMKQHADLARECGVLSTRVIENGQRVGIEVGGEISPIERVPSGVTRLVSGGGVLDGRTRRERYRLARSGVISISFQCDERELVTGRIFVSSRGVVGVDGDEGATSVIQTTVRSCVDLARGRRMLGLEDAVRRAVRSVVLEMSSARPTIIVHILQVENGTE